MRILVSTFAEGDDNKLILAMRQLGYERVVLVCEGGCEGRSLERLRRLEALSGHEVEVREIHPGGFMDTIDQISDVLDGLHLDSKTGRGNEVVLNISGGSKIMGDAALLAAFRLGIEAYHCDRVATRLPVLKGATAKDMFTSLQMRMLGALAAGEIPLKQVIETMHPNSKASTERTIRELKRMRLIKSRVEEAEVLLGLSPEGAEIARATKYGRE